MPAPKPLPPIVTRNHLNYLLFGPWVALIVVLFIISGLIYVFLGGATKERFVLHPKLNPKQAENFAALPNFAALERFAGSDLLRFQTAHLGGDVDAYRVVFAQDTATPIYFDARSGEPIRDAEATHAEMIARAFVADDNRSIRSIRPLRKYTHYYTQRDGSLPVWEARIAGSGGLRVVVDTATERIVGKSTASERRASALFHHLHRIAFLAVEGSWPRTFVVFFLLLLTFLAGANLIFLGIAGHRLRGRIRGWETLPRQLVGLLSGVLLISTASTGLYSHVAHWRTPPHHVTLNTQTFPADPILRALPELLREQRERPFQRMDVIYFDGETLFRVYPASGENPQVLTVRNTLYFSIPTLIRRINIVGNIVADLENRSQSVPGLPSRSLERPTSFPESPSPSVQIPLHRFGADPQAFPAAPQMFIDTLAQSVDSFSPTLERRSSYFVQFAHSFQWTTGGPWVMLSVSALLLFSAIKCLLEGFRFYASSRRSVSRNSRRS